MEGLKERATELLKKLNFDECIELYEKLESGHPMIDMIFDRMEEIDSERFVSIQTTTIGV